MMHPIALAAAVPCALATVYRCETVGAFPKQYHIRAAYLKALQLKEVASGKIVSVEV